MQQDVCSYFQLILLFVLLRSENVFPKITVKIKGGAETIRHCVFIFIFQWNVGLKNCLFNLPQFVMNEVIR